MKAPSRSRSRQTTTADIRLKIEPVGPSAESVRAIAQAMTRHNALRSRLAKTRNRLLGIDILEPLEEAKPARPKPPTQFRAIIYDYTNNQTLFATGNLARPASLEVVESAQQPL